MSFSISNDAFPARGGVGDARAVPGTRRVPGTSPGGDRSPYVELHAHSAYSFLDGASLPEELAARAAELGYDALALTDHDGVYGSLEFAHAAKHLGVRPITGAEVTLEGVGVGSTEPHLSGGAGFARAGAGTVHVTLLCETRQGYANLCRILTDAHAGTREPGRERDLLPAETTIDVVERHAEGLVALSGCARNGLAVVDAKAARTARARVPRRILDRAAAPVRTRRHETKRKAHRACRAPWCAHRRHRQRACAQSVASTAAGRARCDQAPDVARRLRTRTARQPRSGAARASGDARTAASRCRLSHARARRSLPVRPDAGARLSLSRLLRWRRIPQTGSSKRSATEHSPTDMRMRTATRNARGNGSTTSSR